MVKLTIHLVYLQFVAS